MQFLFGLEFALSYVTGAFPFPQIQEYLDKNAEGGECFNDDKIRLRRA